MAGYRKVARFSCGIMKEYKLKKGHTETMRYFLTDGFSSGKKTLSAEKRSLDETGGTGNFLFSFISVSSIESALSRLRSLPDGANIIIDSGAFSAWNSGKSINRQKLYDFYRIVQNEFPQAHFINLDVIPGAKGRKPTKAQARKACEDSWENYLWFKSKGINVMPVFHEDDDWDFLYKMMEETDYIAISPANDSVVKRRIIWLDKVFSILKADYKTHGLAATSPTLLKRYPFFSVDSINWKSPTMFTNSKAVRDNRFTKALINGNQNTRFSMMVREVRYYQQLQSQITRLWEKRGIKWDSKDSSSGKEVEKS